MAKIDMTDKDLEQLETMAGLGLTLEAMAAVIGVCKKTLDRRIADTPAVSDAIGAGRARATQKVAQTAYNLATSGKVPAMTMFWLKCRAGWTEKTPDEIEALKTAASNQQVTKETLLELVKKARGAA